MQSNQLDTLLRRFATAAKAHHEAMEAMDEEKADKHAAMTGALYQSIMASGSVGRERFISLLEHPEPVVAGMAAVYVITIESGKSLTVLRRLAAEPGLLGFRAAAAVDRWESGSWE